MSSDQERDDARREAFERLRAFDEYWDEKPSQTVICEWCGDPTDPHLIVNVTVMDDETADGRNEMWCTVCCTEHLTHEMTHLHPDETS